MGKSEQRELASRLTVLIALLLKWHSQPERQGRSWQITIRNQRRAIQLHLKQVPSLKTKLNEAEWLEIILGDAVYQASKETDLDNFPESCPWSIEDILSDGWMPTSSNQVDSLHKAISPLIVCFIKAFLFNELQNKLQALYPNS